MAIDNSSITFKGNPIPVSGESVVSGEAGPEFSLTANDLSVLDNSSFEGKILIISSVPSLDTPVCAVQTKRFNEEASKLSEQVVVLTVSRDLPMAQTRWCGAEGIDRVVCASDYKDRTFGKAFGVDLESLGLLARAVFVLDKEGRVVHVDYVPEIADEPNYESAIAAVKGLL